MANHPVIAVINYLIKPMINEIITSWYGDLVIQRLNEAILAQNAPMRTESMESNHNV